MFVSGIVGVCKCGREVNVEHDVFDIVVMSESVRYLVSHGCGKPVTITVPREVHRQATAWLKKVAEGKRNDGEPASPEEGLLLKFASDLEGINTVADLEHA